MPDTAPYRDRLKIVWLLAWRGLLASTALAFLFGLVIGFSFARVGSPFREWAQPVSGVVGVLLSYFVVWPWVISMMLRKRFRSFTVQINREDGR